MTTVSSPSRPDRDAPRDQAGVAGAIASTCRQTGAAVGVAVTGAIIAASSAGFVHAGHAAWAVVARLWSDGHAARHGLDRKLGAGDRRAKRRAPGR
jgi:predicted MFS family arabinose efflux permease